MSIKSRAAVAFEPGKPLKIVEVDVEEPKAGEVMVRITHTALCHTDHILFQGQIQREYFPPF